MSKEETECFVGVLELHEFFVEAEHMRELQATITELTALAEPMTKALYKEMANRHTAITIENTKLQAKVEKLEKFVELVEGALGCTMATISERIEPELATLKQEDE